MLEEFKLDGIHTKVVTRVRETQVVCVRTGRKGGEVQRKRWYYVTWKNFFFMKEEGGSSCTIP